MARFPGIRHRLGLIPLIITLCAFAQSPTPVQEATAVTLDDRIESVQVYGGRASVTRRADITLQPGVYDLLFTNLPESIQPGTIQARAAGAVSVLSVDYAQEEAARNSSPLIAELDQQIEDVERRLAEIDEERGLLGSQEAFLDSVSVRATSQASVNSGTGQLDLEALRQQMQFLAEERSKLLTSKRDLDARELELKRQLEENLAKQRAATEGSNQNRLASVSVVATETTQVTLELTYLVSEASWEPVYNIRASGNGSWALVEYDAILTQRTGEDWDEVNLTLSTAQPMLAANPPSIEPWYVDAVGGGGGLFGGGRDAVSALDGEDKAIRKLMQEAGSEQTPDEATSAGERRGSEVASEGTGPAVVFQLPRPVTVRTNIQRQQRTRIANIESRAEFVHVAVPLVTEVVYIRGTLTNAGEWQLLPGEASIFMGTQYLGPTTMPAVPPESEFTMHFGIDPMVRAARTLVSNRTENTGLLSGGRRTAYEYRLAVDNGSGKPIAVELWDRCPVSRSEEIQIELDDLSVSLADDKTYLTAERPLGLLKWRLDVPAGATGPSAAVVTYRVEINRAKDVAMTPLPE